MTPSRSRSAFRRQHGPDGGSTCDLAISPNSYWWAARLVWPPEELTKRSHELEVLPAQKDRPGIAPEHLQIGTQHHDRTARFHHDARVQGSPHDSRTARHWALLQQFFALETLVREDDQSLPGVPSTSGQGVEILLLLRRTPVTARYSMTRSLGRSGSGGYAGFRPAIVSARIDDTARLRIQLRLAGMTYQGAAAVDVFDSASW